MYEPPHEHFNPLYFPYYGQCDRIRWNFNGYKTHSTRYVLCDRLSDTEKHELLHDFSNVRLSTATYRWAPEIKTDVIEIFDVSLDTINKHLPEGKQLENVF